MEILLVLVGVGAAFLGMGLFRLWLQQDRERIQEIASNAANTERRRADSAEEVVRLLNTHLDMQAQLLREAQQHSRRMDRVDRGLHEVEPKPKAPESALERSWRDKVAALVALYGDQGQADLAASIGAARSRTPPESWDSIHGKIVAELPSDLLRAVNLQGEG